LEFNPWTQKHVDVIGHYYEGVQVVPAKFGIAEFKALADAIGDASIFEPQRTCLGAIELLVESRKFLACGHDFFGAQLLQDASRERAVKAPGEEDRAAIGEPVRQRAMVIGQGAFDLA
jgi:hypothetical protein